MRSGTLPKIVMPREELIEALEARRPWAQRLDAKALRKHEADEKRYLAEFHKAVRAAQKWDYEDLKEHYFSVDFDRRDRPSCPSSVEMSLDGVLKALKLDKRKTITVTDSNENSRIYWLLTHDENAKAEMC